MILYLLNLAVGAKETYQNFKETSISYWSTLSNVHSQCKIYFTIETNKTKTTNFVPTKHMALKQPVIFLNLRFLVKKDGS